MRLHSCSILFLFLAIPFIAAPQVPEGYILQYGQNFNGNKGKGDFLFSNPSLWSIDRLQGNYHLHLDGKTRTDNQPVDVPPNRAILKNRIFGDFILEVDVMPVTGDTPSQEICLFVGLKDSTRHYYIVLSADPMSDVQGIYLVRNSISTRLPVIASSRGFTNSNTWQRIRVERNIVSRTIRVFTGKPANLVMEVKDYELVMGSVGFGSLNSAARFDNLNIWAPTVITE